MVLEVLPLVTEADFHDFVHIQHIAFKKGIASRLFPEPTRESTKKDVEKTMKVAKEEPDVHFLKVIDTELNGKAIACAKWRVNEIERSQGQLEEFFKTMEVSENAPLARKDFLTFLERSRRKFMGTKPFFFLHILVTDPEHHRRGAGGMLVRWGTEQADKAQLSSYVEGTEDGTPLYARLGFETVHRETFDLSKYGGEGLEVNSIMIRQPVKQL